DGGRPSSGAARTGGRGGESRPSAGSCPRPPTRARAGPKSPARASGRRQKSHSPISAADIGWRVTSNPMAGPLPSGAREARQVGRVVLGAEEGRVVEAPGEQAGRHV